MSLLAIESFNGAGGTDTVVGTAGTNSSASTESTASHSLVSPSPMSKPSTARGGTTRLTAQPATNTFTLTGDKSALGAGGFAFADIEVFAGNGGDDTVIGTAGDDQFLLVGANVASSRNVSLLAIESFNGAGGPTPLWYRRQRNRQHQRLNGATLLGITYSGVEAFDGAGGTDTVDGTAGNDTFTLTGNESAIGVGGFVFTDIEFFAGNGGPTPLWVPQATKSSASTD